MMINTCIFAYPVGRTFLTEITEGKKAEDDKLQTPVSHSHKSFQLSFITFLLTIFPLYTTWLFRLARVSLYRRCDLRLVNNVIITFYLADFFLMRRALHFATKLNSRYIKKCHCFWVPSNDMFASARKAVFPAPITTAVHRLAVVAVSVRRICHKKVQRSFLNQSLDPPPPPIKNSWIRPCIGRAIWISLQPDWQIDNNFFKRPVMAPTLILVHC